MNSAIKRYLEPVVVAVESFNPFHEQAVQYVDKFRPGVAEEDARMQAEHPLAAKVGPVVDTALLAYGLGKGVSKGLASKLPKAAAKMADAPSLPSARALLAPETMVPKKGSEKFEELYNILKAQEKDVFEKASSNFPEYMNESRAVAHATGNSEQAVKGSRAMMEQMKPQVSRKKLMSLSDEELLEAGSTYVDEVDNLRDAIGGEKSPSARFLSDVLDEIDEAATNYSGVKESAISKVQPADMQKFYRKTVADQALSDAPYAFEKGLNNYQEEILRKTYPGISDADIMKKIVDQADEPIRQSSAILKELGNRNPAKKFIDWREYVRKNSLDPAITARFQETIRRLYGSK